MQLQKKRPIRRCSDLCEHYCSEKENKDSEKIKALVEVLQSEEIGKFITDTYEGAVVPMK